MVSTPNWRRAILFSLTFACLNFQLHAQLPDVFSKLNIDRSCDSYLWVGPTGKGLPPDASEQAVLSPESSSELIFQMLRSRTLKCESAFNYHSLLEKRREMEQKVSAAPLVIMETNYQRFRDNALEKGLVYLENGFLHNTAEEALERHTSLILDIGTHDVSGKQRWYWDPMFFISNNPVFPDEIKIDFGQGWQLLDKSSQIFSIDYADDKEERMIRLLVRRGDSWEGINVVVKSSQCQSSFPLPHATPWEAESADFPWQFSVDDMKANAYTLWSEDGVFDKPFIFVEGIDFDYYHGEDRNGRFGWCQFTGGHMNGQLEFPMLYHLPHFLSDIRERGFDIIMLDFYDGAARIEENGKLLEELIEKCKSHRVGTEPLVVAGASMGGQVARYALRHMEMDGRNHCTRLFVSLDSPHEGAYIPAALQETIYELSQYVEDAAAMIDDKLLRPAARQMLLYQINQPLSSAPNAPLFLEWQQWKSENGLPQKCRNIAIANGSASGDMITDTASELLLEYGCEFSGEIPLVNLDLYPLPGLSNHEYSNQWESVIADITFTENLGLFNGTLTGINQYILHPTVAPNWQKWDYAPGGTRKSVAELVSAFNQNEDFTEQCSSISEDEYNIYHCFVPTASALGIPNVPALTSVVNLINSNPDICPFDDWFFQSNNEEHVEITQSGIEWLEEEIFAGLQENGESWLPNIFTGDGNRFNFYHSSFTRVPSVVVSGNAQMLINNYTNGHYEENYPPSGSHLQVTMNPQCENTTVTLMAGGNMIVGDPTSITSGDLVVEENGFIRILEGGKCVVNRDSKIILKSGASILIDQNGMLELNGGELVLEKGSRIDLRNGNLILKHSNSAIHFKGGIIEVNEGVIWEPFDLEGPSHGKFMVYAIPDEDIILGPSAEMILNGFSVQDVSLVFAEAGHLSCQGVDGSIVRAEKIKVDMGLESNWAINTSCKFLNCHFQSDGNAQFSNWGNAVSLNKTHFSNVQLALNNSRTYALKCRFEDLESNVTAVGGDYHFDHCSFNKCGLFSSAMDEWCSINHCSFDGHYLAVKGFSDKNTEKVFIDNSDWKRYEIATEKINGNLITKCNLWEDNTRALVLKDNAKWVASTEAGGGYNHFATNAIHVVFNESATPDLIAGFNNFEWAGEYLFYGTIAEMMCGWDCDAAALYAHQNLWHNQQDNHYDLHTTASCSSNHPCVIKVIDFNEAVETSCSTLDEYLLESRSDVESVAAWEGEKRTTATLFPNPSHSTVSVNGINEEDILSISIYDMQGRVSNPMMDFSESKKVFSVAHLAPGVYMVRVECTDFSVPLCLVVE